jgi:membrane-associated phospholipid phosphatase
VLLRVHHISDVVAGAGLGLAGALAATVLVNP